MSKLLIIISLLMQVAACGRDAYFKAMPAHARVVILGDSLTYGTGANAGEDYPSILASKTGWHIVNAGVPGNTSANGLEHLPAILAEDKIDLLIVELGGNDFIHQLPVNDTAQNLEPNNTARWQLCSSLNLPEIRRISNVATSLSVPAESPSDTEFQLR